MIHIFSNYCHITALCSLQIIRYRNRASTTDWGASKSSVTRRWKPGSSRLGFASGIKAREDVRGWYTFRHSSNFRCSTRDFAKRPLRKKPPTRIRTFLEPRRVYRFAGIPWPKMTRRCTRWKAGCGKITRANVKPSLIPETRAFWLLSCYASFRLSLNFKLRY